jgi:hypothetical protein
MILLLLFLFFSCLQFGATLAHELGHVGAAVLLGGRVQNVRVRWLRMRVHRRRGSRLWDAVTLHRVRISKNYHGECQGSPPRGWLRNAIYSGAGYPCEWLVLFCAWRSVHWLWADANTAWNWALIGLSLFSVESALESFKRGGDLYFVRRSWGRRHVKMKSLK